MLFRVPKLKELPLDSCTCKRVTSIVDAYTEQWILWIRCVLQNQALVGKFLLPLKTHPRVVSMTATPRRLLQESISTGKIFEPQLLPRGCPRTCLCGTGEGKAEKSIPVCGSEHKSVGRILPRQLVQGVMKWGKLRGTREETVNSVSFCLIRELAKTKQSWWEEMRKFPLA